MTAIRWLGVLGVALPALVVAQPCPTVEVGGPDDCNENGILDSCEVEPYEIGLVPGRIYEVEAPPDAIRSGDFNGDGRGDLAVSTSPGLEILYGYSSGVFGRGPRFPEIGTLDEPAICDVDGDGRDDLVVLRTDGVTLEVYISDEEGVPQGRETLSTDPRANSIQGETAGDVDGDGAVDLLYRSVTTDAVQLLPGDGAGSFGASRTLIAGENIFTPVLMDVDGDEDLDIVASTSAIAGTYYLRVYRNDGGGGFVDPPIDAFSDDRLVHWFWLEDLDADGAVDLVIAGRPHLLLARNRGDGTYEPPQSTDIAAPGDLQGIDLDQDGDLDLAGRYSSGIVVLESEPGEAGALPSFSTNPEHAWPLPRIGPVVALTLVDHNGDGLPSLAALADAGAHSQVSIIRTTDVPLSLDCNENGIPDTCDIASSTSADCSLDGIPDECQVRPDCNQNGVPDFCEVDCNANRRPDDCDLALGDSEDLDGDLVPDECQVEGVFELRLQGPATMLSGSREVYQAVLTPGSEIQGSPDGAQGWSFGVSAQGLSIVGATTDGTLLRDPVHGFGNATSTNFNVVQLTTGEGNEGVVAAFVIFGMWTLPTDTALDILQIEVEARGVVLPDEESPLLFFREGLQAPGAEPVAITVTRLGSHVEPDTLDREVTLEGSFLRGDANADGAVDMSDAIYSLNGLFVGSFWYQCEKSGDANDDGAVDVSDPIFTLGYLFQGTAPIPEPLGTCGLDRTVDILSCDEFPPCS